MTSSADVTTFFQERLVPSLAVCPMVPGPVKCRRFPSMAFPSWTKMLSHTRVSLGTFGQQYTAPPPFSKHYKNELWWNNFQLFNAALSVILALSPNGHLWSPVSMGNMQKGVIICIFQWKLLMIWTIHGMVLMKHKKKQNWGFSFNVQGANRVGM